MSTYRLLALSFVVAAAAVAGAVGPTSMLYAVNNGEFGSTTGMDRIQGASIASTSSGNPSDFAIAVSGDVRTCGYMLGFTGSRFDLAGNPVAGGPYANTYAADPIYDGTSDGNYNYGLGMYSGVIFRYDRNWNNPVSLFGTGTPGTISSGITLNPSDGSFWVSNAGSAGQIEHYSAGGAFLGSFATGIGFGYGLAFDSADGTLWANSVNTPGRLFQFSQSGTMLQVAGYAVPSGQFYGMEFNTAATPEPASIAAFAMGALGLLKRRCRRNR